MSLRKLSRGEAVQIAAKDYNRWQDAGLANALSKLNQSTGLALPDSQEGIILIKNGTGRDLPRYSVLGIRGTIPDPRYSTQQSIEFQNAVQLRGEVPSSTTSGRFCVLQVDARAGEVVPAMVSGVTPVRLRIETITDEFAEIETTSTYDKTAWLKSGSTGSAQILYQPEVLGPQWGVVRLSNRPPTSTGVVLAYFAAGVDPVVTYPAKTSVCRKFPAYLYSSWTYDNDTTSGGYNCQTAATAAGSPTEQILVYNLRKSWIPNTIVLPVFEFNDRWWVDYSKPAGPLSLTPSTLTLGSATTTDITYSASELAFDGNSLTVDIATGVITAHRELYAVISVDLTLELDTGPATSDQQVFLSNSAAGGATVVNMCESTITFRDTSQTGTRKSLSSRAHVSMPATSTIKFTLTNGSGEDVNIVSGAVLADTQVGW